MKSKILILLVSILLVFGTGCKTSKVVEKTTTSDTTTVVYQKPVEVQFKADTASSGHNITEFNQSFQKARSGDIIAEKKGNRVSYKVKKTNDDDFEIEAIADAVDTTIVVQDTHTTIKTNERVVVEKGESWMEKAMDAVVRYLVVTGMIFLVVVILVLRLKP